MQVSSNKQEVEKARMFDILKENGEPKLQRVHDGDGSARAEKAQPSQSRVIHIVLDSDCGASHDSSKKTLSEKSVSSRRSLHEDQLAQEMERLMCSILEQGLLIDQELGMQANSGIDDNHANVDVSVADSPPKVPAASN